MAVSPLVLVDTSVWIRFFRSAHSPEAKALDVLLSLGPVATCAPVRAEVISGATTVREFEQLRTLFGTLVMLQPPDDLWPRIEESRYALARRGYQASLVDLMIAITAHAHQTTLWTVDADFHHLSAVIPITQYHPEVIPE